MDDALGRLFAFLKRSGIYERALIVVVADHGEQFKEHGRMHHGNALYNEELHVPFFVRDGGSGRPPALVEHVVSTVDLFPTVLGQLGVAIPPTQADGVSVFSEGALAARAGVLGEIRRVTDQRGFVSRDLRKAIFAVPLREQAAPERDAQWESPRLVGVFDIREDYLEQHPLADAPARAHLEAELRAAFGKAARGERADTLIPAGQLSDETLQQLKGLGYLTER
jgi:arylsulfatase A-like enzyme